MSRLDRRPTAPARSRINENVPPRSNATRPPRRQGIARDPAAASGAHHGQHSPRTSAEPDAPSVSIAPWAPARLDPVVSNEHLGCTGAPDPIRPNPIQLDAHPEAHTTRAGYSPPAPALSPVPG